MQKDHRLRWSFLRVRDDMDEARDDMDEIQDVAGRSTGCCWLHCFKKRLLYAIIMRQKNTEGRSFCVVIKCKFVVFAHFWKEKGAQKDRPSVHDSEVYI